VGFEEEALGAQPGHGPFNVPEHKLVLLPAEPPLGDAVQGILGFWIVVQVAQDLPRDVGYCGGSRLIVHGTPPSFHSSLYKLPTPMEKGKSDATYVDAWNLLIYQAAER
jgi:hypothetical protein